MPEDIKAYCSDWVASIPKIYFELKKIIDDPECSFAELERIIKSDPVLTARLLKIVNSPFYNFPSKIETISRALHVIGTQQLSDLVLATTIMEQFKGIPRELVHMKSFWKHSIATGVIAQHLAAETNEHYSERFYVAGALHDIGSLVIYNKNPNKAREALVHSRQHDDSLFKSESDVFGFNHADVGGALLGSWKLPTPLVEAVSYHHFPSSAKNDKKLTAVVHIADALAYAMEYGGSGETHVPPIDPNAMKELGILQPYLTEINERIRPTINETITMFI